MTLLRLAVVVGLCAAVSAQSGQALADLEKFHSVISDNNKAMRALHDIRTVQNPTNKRVGQAYRSQDSVSSYRTQEAPSMHAYREAPTAQAFRAQEALTAQATRAPSNIVYGKGRQAEQPKYTRSQFAPQKTKSLKTKFTPSPEEPSYEQEAPTQYANNFKLSPQDTETLQKYMQKYANQLYAAQKHATQLSESQKYVLAQDPYAKKFVAQPQKQQKFIPLKEVKEPVVAYGYQDESQEAPEPITERYQNYQVQQKLTVQNSKPVKTPPKKAYSPDNFPQYTSMYGSSLEPQVVNQYLTTYGASNKESFTGYEPHQSYGQYGLGSGTADKSELSKITGYRIPGAVSLSLGHQHGLEDKEHVDLDHHEEHHYPTAEPKYEFMYQVQDHEKHNHFGHSEARKGKSTWGRYYVQLPDGRFETVKYWADKSGYHAEVDFKGHAKHPSHKEHGHEGSSYSGGNIYKGHSKPEEHSSDGYSISELSEEF